MTDYRELFYKQIRGHLFDHLSADLSLKTFDTSLVWKYPLLVNVAIHTNAVTFLPTPRSRIIRCAWPRLTYVIQPSIDRPRSEWKGVVCWQLWPWIKRNKNDEYGYNLMPGGSGSEVVLLEEVGTT